MHISARLTMLFFTLFFSFSPFVYAKEVAVLFEKNVILIPSVPFTSQAPTGDWKDGHFQNGCEEASVIMAMQWVRGKKSLSKKQAEKDILSLADYQEKTYDSSVDTSAQDTVDRLFKEYYTYTNIKVAYGITKKDIHAELEKGNLVITPMNGRKLKNPHFHSPGPTTHMILIRGYDAKKKEFITNDPGTKYGELYRYKESVLESALRDYPTGDHVPVTTSTRAMIIIYPQKSL